MTLSYTAGSDGASPSMVVDYEEMSGIILQD
jgi:hypothetical protein